MFVFVSLLSSDHRSLDESNKSASKQASANQSEHIIARTALYCTEPIGQLLSSDELSAASAALHIGPVSWSVGLTVKAKQIRQFVHWIRSDCASHTRLSH